MRPTHFLGMRPTQSLGMRPSQRLMRPVPKDEHSAHTISQRIRTLKKIPPELIPLGVVMIAALAAAVFSSGRKLYTDKTLRLTRAGGSPKPGGSGGHGGNKEGH